MINAPREVIIAGEHAGCERAIRRLGCNAMRLSFNGVLHCDAVDVLYDTFVQLHTLPSHEVPDIDFYSAVDGAPLSLETEALAHNIGKIVSNPVDFPRIVERVYDDGARIFVDPGPRGTAAAWVDCILKNQPHLAVALDRKGRDSFVSYLRALAKLSSHRVPLDLSSLYGAAEAQTRPQRTVQQVTLGGRAIDKTILAAKGILQAPGESGREEQSQIAAQEAETHNGQIPCAATEASSLTASTELQTLAQRSADLSHSHRAFLAKRGEVFRHLARLLGARGGTMAPAPPCDIPGAQNSTPSRPIWNRADLLRFARADIAGVFGADYAVIDTYARRVRLPTPPYLLVSRVTGLQAQRGAFKPSAITTEYDIPQDAWYSVDGQVPWAVAVESGQCDLLLISYLGIDFSCRGERVYRLLDCTLTFLEEMPLEGDTLRYDIKISRFSHSGDSLLFFFSYECFAGGRTILKMDGGCAGFFSDGELEQGKGVIFSEAELAARRGAPRRSFAAPLTCAHTAFDRRRLLCLTRGDLVGCFGPTHDPQGRNPSLRLPPEAMLMIDRIAAVDPRGGAWGLGLVVAEKDLAPDHWYFPCHFKDDQVLAGSLIGEACAQILQFYHLFLGLQTHTRDARFQPVLDQPQKVRCRGQVLPSDKLLTYRIEVRDIGLAPAAYIKADVEVVLEGKTIVYFEGLGVQLVEKADTDPRRVATPRARTAGIAPFDEAQLREFAIGSVEKCFGTVFSIYQNRRVPRIPNGDLHLISRVLEVENTPEGSDGLGRLLSEYDVLPDPWFYDRCSHFCPPYSVLMELALQPCGFLSACVGAILDFPDIDFYFRNLDGQAYLSREVDLRGKTVTNRVRLLSSTSLKGVIIQKFDFELACDGAPFYRGDAAFGYFTEKALASQVGLDGGEQVSPWCEGEKSRTREVALATLQKSPPERPHFHLASGQLHFLDTALVLAAGGRHGRGYVYARKAVDPRDWFYACHFYQDPVMPGSLGVEAILQAIEIYALHQDLGDDFASPCFRLVSDHRTVWKYRGQILPGAGTMELEVNISEVVQRDQQCLLIADASLWKDGLRIYEIRDAAVCIAESAPCSTSP